MGFLYLIWFAEIIAIGAVIWWKSRQPPMTKGEQFYELACVSQRQNSFLLNTTKQSAYNGVEG